MQRPHREPAMTDVARVAGVSHQTVSRVLNDHPKVRDETRNRVLAAIAQLGYRPNFAARALVTGRSRVLGVVAQNSTLYGPASMLAALEQASAGAGFSVSVRSVSALDRESISGAIEQHIAQRVAGIVVIAPVATASDALDELSTDMPLVAIDGDPDRDTSVVTVDQVAGGAVATQHLLDAGHETVWHVSGPPGWYDSAGRIKGWHQTLLEAGIEAPPIIPADWSAESGYRAGQMLARIPEVTAVFAANDHLALGILRALHERGRQVPRDLSVVGFDDVPEAAYFIPPLSTVRPDFQAAAKEALAMLLEGIETGHRQSRRRIIAPTLVVRDSVAVPPL